MTIFVLIAITLSAIALWKSYSGGGAVGPTGPAGKNGINGTNGTNGTNGANSNGGQVQTGTVEIPLLTIDQYVQLGNTSHVIGLGSADAQNVVLPRAGTVPIGTFYNLKKWTSNITLITPVSVAYFDVRGVSINGGNAGESGAMVLPYSGITIVLTGKDPNGYDEWVLVSSSNEKFSINVDPATEGVTINPKPIGWSDTGILDTHPTWVQQ